MLSLLSKKSAAMVRIYCDECDTTRQATKEDEGVRCDWCGTVYEGDSLIDLKNLEEGDD